MKYYLVAIKGKRLPLLTYSYEGECPQGMKVYVSLRGQEQEGYIVEACEKPDFSCESLQCSLENEKIPLPYFLVCQFLAHYYLCSWGQALSLMNLTSIPESIPLWECHAPITLSQRQSDVVNLLKKHSQVLLFGDTGSGKTEIYLFMIQEILHQSQSALVLMPEIALTPQMEVRFRHYLGDCVALWHSGQSKKVKKKVLEEIAQGKIRVLIGARSALFVPLSNLGIIIVDEEHDDSYKSSTTPKYHAKEVALMLGKYTQAHVILGSATPSLTTFHRLPHVRLKETFFEASRQITYVEGNDELTPLLTSYMRETLLQHQQVILFVPTRANFRYLRCQSCGYVFSCSECSVAMSVHLQQKSLVCHYCHKTLPLAHECPECRSHDLSSLRNGTAHLVTLLEEIFPEATIGRFDKDSTSTETKLKATLKAFNDKKIDILVGTQMVAKGHDYHNVGLVVALGIDYILHIPDYRSREKALSLLIQLCGRVGRKGEGKVAISTYNSSFFERYLSHYDQFLEDEAIYRKGLYPPFQRLALLKIEDKDEKKGEQKTEKLAHSLVNIPNFEVVGWGKAPLEKLSGKWRFHILVRSPMASVLIQTLRSYVSYADITIEPLDLS